MQNATILVQKRSLIIRVPYLPWREAVTLVRVPYLPL